MNMTTAQYNSLASGKSAPAKAKRNLPPIDTAPFIEATRRARITAGDGWTRIVLPMPPSVNNLYSTVTIKHGPRKGLQIRALSEEGKRYKLALRRICREVNLVPLTGDVNVVIEIFRPRKSGDVQNYDKAVFDGLKPDGDDPTGRNFGAYHDDGQVKWFAMGRHEDAANPRAEVRIRLTNGETLNLEFMR